MLTSARNTLRGIVKSVRKGAVNAEIELAVGAAIVTAIVTNESADALRLSAGDPAYALIKASSVILAKQKPERISARNILTGHITQVIPGAVNAEVIIELGGAKLTAIVTNDAVKDLVLTSGDAVFAIVKASSVIIGA